MRDSRKLELRRERLAELAPEALRAAGGYKLTDLATTATVVFHTPSESWCFTVDGCPTELQQLIRTR